MGLLKALKHASELEERLSTTERKLKALSLDMDDLWDRFKRLSGRLAKRDEREQTAEQEPRPGEAGAEILPTASPIWAKLTPRQRQIQMSVLARRGNGGAQ